MKKILLIFLGLVLSLSFAACGSNNSVSNNSSSGVGSTPSHPNTTNSGQSGSPKGPVLVVYFSYSGHTRTIANQIHEQVGGDIFEIKTANPYTSDYNAVVDQAKQEQAENARPKLSGHVEDMNKYNTVFIGYPIWWYDMPMPVYSFLEEYNFSGKTIIPFCTHGGSGFSNSIQNMQMQKNLSGATFLNGLAIRDTDVSHAQNDVTNWLRSLKMIQ